jgi:hypothetical protein
MHLLHERVFSLVLTFFLLLSSLVAAMGNYGPDTCLEGWVWREAYTGDVVCVTPATRTQAAEDNAAASSRVVISRWPFKSKLCKSGYVWRQADPTDYVCVLPATAAQAQADNAQAANRRASLNIWLSTWTDPNLPWKTCAQGTNTVGVVVNGDHFNLATVTVGIYNLVNNATLASVTLPAIASPPLIAGTFSLTFNIPYCAPSLDSFPDAFAQAYDHDSDRNSTWAVFYEM